MKVKMFAKTNLFKAWWVVFFLGSPAQVSSYLPQKLHNVKVKAFVPL